MEACLTRASLISLGHRLHALTSSDNGADGVAGRRQGTEPATVVSARGVIKEVQIDDEVVETSTEIGALRCIERISAAAIALSPCRTVPKWQKDPTRVLLEPPHVDDRIDRRREFDAPDQHHCGAVLITPGYGQPPARLGC